MSRTTPNVFKAGDMIFDPLLHTLRGTGYRPMTQEEADLLNSIHPDQDEHALEALAGVEARVTGWRLALAWVLMLGGAWVVVLAAGYGLYELLRWVFGDGL